MISAGGMNVYSVCGVLVMTRPESGPIVEDALKQYEGVEVHARDEHGKLVVTIEGLHSRQVADTIADFSNIKGVVSTSLVYHEIDVDDQELNPSESPNREDR